MAMAASKAITVTVNDPDRREWDGSTR